LNISWFYLKNVKLLEKLVTLINKINVLVNELLKKLVILINMTSALVNGLLKKLVLLVNEISSLVNRQLEKSIKLVIEQIPIWAREDINMSLNCANYIDL
jgi:hypothetical protein